MTIRKKSVMPKQQEPVMPKVAMTITIGFDGSIVDVTNGDWKGKVDSTPIPSGNIKESKMEAYPVLAYTKTLNPTTQRCVTVQTPQGPKTI